MDRDVALGLDVLLMAVRDSLNGVAYYMKRTLPAEDFSELMTHIEEATQETTHISSGLHLRFSDILPQELRLLDGEPNADIYMGVGMDRDLALRLDGMLKAVAANLDGIAHYMKNNLSAEEFSNRIVHIGRAMAKTFDISLKLYSRYPDIWPRELRPQNTGSGADI